MIGARVMIGMVFGLLLTGVGANVYLVYAASRDPSFAVEPAYYEKAMRWDETQAERAKSEALGWSVEVHLEDSELRVQLVDGSGRAIEGAVVELEVFHNARSKERRLGVATPAADAYVLSGRFERSGLWVIRIRASNEGALFVGELELTKP